MYGRRSGWAKSAKWRVRSLSFPRRAAHRVRIPAATTANQSGIVANPFQPLAVGVLRPPAIHFLYLELPIVAEFLSV